MLNETGRTAGVSAKALIAAVAAGSGEDKSWRKPGVRIKSDRSDAQLNY
jgi:hypothetical protein